MLKVDFWIMTKYRGGDSNFTRVVSGPVETFERGKRTENFLHS